MGLAASQARLLSITSRMSDNELRSQLINNAKIRLTTDSARVSEEYVAALNKTKLMFSNFDMTGNEMSQALTFNSLTAYSSYNNQYGIVNSGGEILVSALDAGNFERAGGNVDRFLEQYGLEKTTTYYDNLDTSRIGYYDTFGKWQNIDATPEELRIMYEGGVDTNGITHYGLQGNYNSSEYAEYLELVDNYNSAKGDYNDTLKKYMKKFADGEEFTNIDLNSSLSNTAQQEHRFAVDEFTTTGIDNNILLSFSQLANTVATADFTTSNNFATIGKYTAYFYKLMYQLIDQNASSQVLGFNMANTPPRNPNNIMAGYTSPLYLDTDNIVKDEKFKELLPYLNKALQILDIKNAGTWVNSAPVKPIYTYNEYDITKVPVYATVGTYTYSGNSYSTISAEYSDLFSFDYHYKASIDDDPANSTNLQYVANTTYGYGTVATFTSASQATNANALYIEGAITSNSGTSGNEFKQLYYREINSNDEFTDRSNPNYVSPSRRVTINGNAYVLTWAGANDWDNTAKEYTCDMSSNNSIPDGAIIRDDNGAPVGLRVLTYQDYTPSSSECSEALKSLYSLINDNLYDILDETIFRNVGLDEVDNAYTAFQTAAENLAQFIWGDADGSYINGQMFGDDANYGYYNNLDDQGWVLSATNDQSNRHYNPYNNDPTHPIETTHTLLGQNYQVVKDMFYVECMLEHFGVPNYTWIDVNNHEENGEAKAQWYTNLFNRMNQGYKELTAGLTGSEEWMQFAFESGLVHMEQVNKSSQWISTMYSNCSKISENTVDVDITIAEAKYKREMNKIEAKDKKYDMELKNIDTEHESLKQEYESIKKVIQNNVKNNYTLFGNG